MPHRKLVLGPGSLEARGLEAAGSEASWMAGFAAWRFGSTIRLGCLEDWKLDRLEDGCCNLTRTMLGEVGGFNI